MSTQELAAFLAKLRYEDLPEPAIDDTKRLFLDWVGATLAGRGARPVECLESLARAMGPATGPSEILTNRTRTSPLFAAMVNAAASHVVEQDDLHNASVMHPGTVVFPASLAVAQALGRSGKDLIVAAVAGYEAATRAGEFLGPSHYRVFHTTGTAGTLGAAAAAAHLLGADERTMNHALGSAGTVAGGLWEFLRDAADSKQLHAASAASKGVLAAWLARDGFTGASRILEGDRGLGAGTSSAPRPSALTDGLGHRWAVCQTSMKFHACCRHTHPATDALLHLRRKEDLDPDDIERIEARVYQAAFDVVGTILDPATVHQSKFSLPFVLALAAIKGSAGIEDFDDAALHDPTLRTLASRIDVKVDAAIEAAYPGRWGSAVDVRCKSGRTLRAEVSSPKGDPDNRLSRDELEDKVHRLARYASAASPPETQGIISQAWALEELNTVGTLLPSR